MSYKKIPFSSTTITGGLWKEKQDLVRNVTAKAIYNRFSDTGRIEAFTFKWKPGMPNQPHYFWDSDVAKWMEGAAYLICKQPNAELEALVDDLVANIQKNQCEDGYFNIYFTVVEPDKRFACRDWHELYCAGHLLEAAIAYAEATGKDTFLTCMKRYIDYIDERFRIKQDTPFTTPGHEEIELALVKLYDYTQEQKYLDLAKFFIDKRGEQAESKYDWMNPSYNQSHLPVRQQTTAEGHSVRAVYLYCAMADLAERTGDEALKHACEEIFADIVNRKMYITGGIGSSSSGEAFTVPYDLSNLLAYTETCAALGLALFANRMLQFGAKAEYADCVERVIYNGFLSALSLDGKSFFYENPLEVMPYLATRDTSVTVGSVHWPQMHRSEVFSCSCCPPNIMRFIPSIAGMLYTEGDGILYVHQYMDSQTNLSEGGKQMVLTQSTRYPEDGKVSFTVAGGDLSLRFRIPWWCEKSFAEYAPQDGYASVLLKDGQPFTVDFGMPIHFIEARPDAKFDCCRFAVMRGPVVYCLEGEDNGDNLRDIRLDSNEKMKYSHHDGLNVPMLIAKAYRRQLSPKTPLYSVKHDSTVPVTATLIPYYAFANRSISPMQVWCTVV